MSYKGDALSGLKGVDGEAVLYFSLLFIGFVGGRGQ